MKSIAGQNDDTTAGVGARNYHAAESRACSSVIKPPNRLELGIERPTRRVWFNNMLDRGQHRKILDIGIAMSVY